MKNNDDVCITHFDIYVLTIITIPNLGLQKDEDELASVDTKEEGEMFELEKEWDWSVMGLVKRKVREMQRMVSHLVAGKGRPMFVIKVQSDTIVPWYSVCAPVEFMTHLGSPGGLWNTEHVRFADVVALKYDCMIVFHDLHI